MILFRTYVSVEGNYSDGTERLFSTIFPKVPPFWYMTRTRAEASTMRYLLRKLAKISNDSPRPTSFHVRIHVTARLPGGRQGTRHISNDSFEEKVLNSCDEAVAYVKTQATAAFDELAALQ